MGKVDLEIYSGFLRVWDDETKQYGSAPDWQASVRMIDRWTMELCGVEKLPKLNQARLIRDLMIKYELKALIVVRYDENLNRTIHTHKFRT